MDLEQISRLQSHILLCDTIDQKCRNRISLRVIQQRKTIIKLRIRDRPRLNANRLLNHTR